ncbi:dioxygenase [Mycetohabitans endofungorum]|uniref:DODA-type extradiol aromatic ring-opening family dioxygenase n=1 Tax=Mycetohabitans endofungorum TaxID=417203 RepID=UPI0030CC546E
MPCLPAVFLSHGAPTLPIDPSMPRVEFAALATRWSRPRAILVLSAHWTSTEPVASLATAPETIHDFYGFPRALYELTYDAPGAPDVAQRAIELLRQAGIAASGAVRGLDHGAWVPHEGVLIVGSGQITHNLRAADFSARPEDANPHVAEFTGWFEARMATHDLGALLDYRQQAPYAVSMHPSDEHLLPVFAALGAADDDYKLEIHAQGTYQRSLAMTHYVL